MNQPQLSLNPRALAGGVSFGLHAVAVGLACFLAFSRELEQPGLTCTLDLLRDEQPELQVFRIAASEPSSKSLSEPEANEISPIPPGSLLGLDGLAASFAGIRDLAWSAGEPVDSNHSVAVESLLAYPVTGMLDASRYFGNDPAVLRASVASTPEARRELFSSLAAEIFRISPNHVSSVVFVPLGDSSPVRNAENGSESVRQSVIDWGNRLGFMDSRNERDGIVRPSAHLIIVVSDSPVPMAKLRQIADRWFLRVPMRVICLKSDQRSADRLESLASASDSAYFGIE